MNRGERVKVIEDRKGTSKTWIIKKIFESDDGIPIYLLKSETDPALRLYYETEDSFLEKV